MASGSAIDEQYKECWECWVTKLPTYEELIRPDVPTWTGPEDGDFDPNDVPTSQLQTRRQRPRVVAGPSGLRPPMDSSDEDDDDY